MRSSNVFGDSRRAAGLRLVLFALAVTLCAAGGSANLIIGLF